MPGEGSRTGVVELGLEPAVAQPGCVPWHRTCPQHPPEEAGGGWGVASGFVSVPVERSQPGYRPPPGTAWLQGDGAGKSPGACAGFPEGRDGPIRVGRAARRPPAPRGSPAAAASHGFVSVVDFLQLQEQKNCTERGAAHPPPCSRPAAHSGELLGLCMEIWLKFVAREVRKSLRIKGLN